MVADKASPVLVTGVTGYIALHVVKSLQAHGYKVRGTVRSLSNEKKLKPVRDVTKSDMLELVEANLLSDSGWVEAVKGCQYVLHVASPFPNVPPKNEDDVIRPAVEGTKRVLQACAAAGGVKRVVLTSSICAVHGETTVDQEKTHDEEDWSDLDSPYLDAYAKSKTLAEKEAWDFVRNLPKDKSFELSVINPGLVLGPILTSEASTSVEVLSKMMNPFTMPLIPGINFCVCDVRDVALAHVRAMTEPEAAGQRHLVVSTHMWMSEMAHMLAETFAPMGYRISLWRAPNFTLWFYSFVDKSTSLIIPRLDKVYLYDDRKMKKVLKIQPRDVKQTLLDTVHSLVQRGAIKKTKYYVPPQNLEMLLE